MSKSDNLFFQPNLGLITGESLVLAGLEGAGLLGSKIAPQSFSLRSTYLPQDRGAVQYEMGRDYTVDFEKGLVFRTPESRIPDYREHPFFGKASFDHTTSPDFTNARFLVYADYDPGITPDSLNIPTGPRLFSLKKIPQKKISVVAFGDSITAGYDATVSERSYAMIWAETLARKYPELSFVYQNKAVGGKTSTWGAEAFESQVAPLAPDLLLLAFGMNDQNLTESGDIATPPEIFLRNIKSMCDFAKKAVPSVQIGLVSPMTPNPRWKYASGRMGELRDVLKEVADQNGFAFADVTSFWLDLLSKKSFESLAWNNVNHPNDFTHRLYARVVEAATLPL